jgi:hypothetical protein
VTSSNAVDLDGSPLPLYNSGAFDITRAISQEFQLNLSAFAERLEVVTGLYYFHSYKREDPIGLTTLGAPVFTLEQPIQVLDSVAAYVDSIVHHGAAERGQGTHLRS